MLHIRFLFLLLDLHINEKGNYLSHVGNVFSLLDFILKILLLMIVRDCKNGVCILECEKKRFFVICVGLTIV